MDETDSSSMWDEVEGQDSPICPFCGVSALAPEPGQPSTCENADCDAFDEAIS